MKRGPVQIETERLLLRRFTPLDQDDLLAILGDEETMRFSEQAFSREQTNHFLLDFCVKQQNAFAAESRETGHVIGYLLFHETDPGIYEIGWFFNRQVWGNGYALESASALLRHAFSTLHAHKVVAETTDNVRSGKLMRRLGMTLEGVQRRQIRNQDGNWVDLYLYGIFPREVKPFSYANTQKNETEEST